MSRRRKSLDTRNVAIIILGVLVVILAGMVIRGHLKKPAAKIQKEAILPKVALPQKLPVTPKGKIALIIDDWGYNTRDCEKLQEIKAPLTISVLPNLAHSNDAASCAYSNHKEVILHLPLEPHKTYEQYPQDYVILTTMPKQQVVNIFENELSSVPFAKGINNHMGSKATEDPALMTLLFDQMEKHHLYFIDSLVTDRSVCDEIAKKFNIPFASRDIFLDNESDRTYIQEQFSKLARLAKRRGYAIGIGHDRTLTLDVIKKQTEALERKGFVFLTVSELLNTQ